MKDISPKDKRTRAEKQRALSGAMDRNIFTIPSVEVLMQRDFWNCLELYCAAQHIDQVHIFDMVFTIPKSLPNKQITTPQL